ncbi:hypothetical protein [Pseudoalteromonas sp. BDTF-M6]|uniref:hypothetical protein n=1 Tax=Pseudoalteromonas sp. BDTF-M6 TaxID=2796132 RepID=UPI001BAFAB7A|nr:hypothetical protein [Pseudoalteromonas sp. BDTF-M6]MBS3797831.1 hypothetical protein [Pseudoalteromonas sp. BDTF-M6]
MTSYQIIFISSALMTAATTASLLHSYLYFLQINYLQLLLCFVGFISTWLSLIESNKAKAVTLLFWLVQTLSFGGATQEYSFAPFLALKVTLGVNLHNYAAFNLLAIYFTFYSFAKIESK